MTQPAEQTDFRYFRDASGYRWKMPTDGTYGYVLESGRWAASYVTLRQTVTYAEDYGTIETDATGAPLAPAAPGGEQRKLEALKQPLRVGDRVTLLGGEVHTITEKNSMGELVGNDAYYRWEENGEIAHAAMGYDDNRYEIVKHEPSPPAGGGDAPPPPIGFSLAPGFDPNGVPSHRWPFIALLWEGKWKVGYVATATDTYALHWEYPNAEKWTVATPPPAATPTPNPNVTRSKLGEGEAPRTDDKVQTWENDMGETIFEFVDPEFARTLECEIHQKDARIAELERESAGLREIIAELIPLAESSVLRLPGYDDVMERAKSALAGGEEGKDV